MSLLVTKCVVAGLLMGAIALPSTATPQTVDPRCRPIPAEVLDGMMAGTPLTSENHAKLIHRAFCSGLSAPAYENYLRLAETNPNCSEAHLWGGLAALAYYDAYLGPSSPDASVTFSKQKTDLWNKLMKEASTHLRQAVALNPRSGLAHAELGFWRFQWGNEVAQGIAELEQGIALSPKSARAHYQYADAIGNPSTGFYDAHRAEVEYKKAIALDGTYAAPHHRLAWLYFYRKDYQRARRAFADYETRLPEAVRGRKHLLRTLLAKVS